jgi:hypothetical protein
VARVLHYPMRVTLKIETSRCRTVPFLVATVLVSAGVTFNAIVGTRERVCAQICEQDSTPPE